MIMCVFYFNTKTQINRAHPVFLGVRLRQELEIRIIREVYISGSQLNHLLHRFFAVAMVKRRAAVAGWKTIHTSVERYDSRNKR